MEIETNFETAYKNAANILNEKWSECEDEASKFYNDTNDYDWNCLTSEEREYFTKGVIAGLKQAKNYGLYDKNTLIRFAADMVHKALNPESTMCTPNALYIKLESELENWEK